MKLLSSYQSKLFFLCMLLAIGRFAFDMYLPSLLFITEYFKTDYTLVEQTISSYLLGLTFSQLLFGPLSDCWGRRKVLIIGISLFSIGSLICIYSYSIYMLTFGRLLCGMGLSVGPCLKRALLTDWFSDKNKIRQASGTVSSVLMFATIIAPYLGGLLQRYSNSWYMSFVMVGIWGVFILLYIAFYFKDSKVFNGNLNLKHIIADYVTVSSNGHFMIYSMVTGFAFANMIVYFQIIPYLFAFDISNSAKYFGYAASFAGISYIIGGYLLFMLPKERNASIISISLLLMALAGLLGCVLFIIYEQRIIMILPLFIAFVALRWLLPAILAEAMLTQAKSGTASSMMGFIQYMLSTILSYAFSFLNAQLIPYIFFIEMFLTSIVAYYLLRKHLAFA